MKGSAARASRVLIVDDQARTSQALARLAPDLDLLAVKDGPGDPRLHARSWTEAEPLLADRRRTPDAVVLDLVFDLPDDQLLPDRSSLGEGAAAKRTRRERRDRQGLYILERLRRAHPDLAVILTTAYEDIPFEEEALALRADAFTYAVGPEESTGEGILRLLRRALAERDAPRTTGRFFWGSTAAMRELRRRIVSLSPTPLPLLVTGPTGTGKNLLARDVIHPLSGRTGPFVAFDCATVPEGLLQAALFGATRGAFTGAIADRAGVFEAAAEGTLFLDEIENLTPDAQKTLLTALNDGTIRRLGATAEIPHSARVVAASNIDLAGRASGGSFRADLLMRLNPSLTLELPPLSERREDLPDLARLAARAFFTEPRHRRAVAALVRSAGAPEPGPAAGFALSLGGDVAEEGAAIVFSYPRKVWAAMERHAWPGNVRQFDMVLADTLAAAVYAGGGPSVDRAGRATFDVDARLAFGLLAGAKTASPPVDQLVLARPRSASVARFRRELERSALRALFQAAGGDFGRMAEMMTGSSKEARAVRLRFNKLGLSAREEK